MKRLFFTIILFSILCSGCKKWLDVKPTGETTQEELFKTQKGFRDALTGAYIRMKSGNTYGSAMTWGNIEYLAHNWDNANTSNTALTDLIAWRYTNQTVRDRLDATYLDLFKEIADVNNILEKIEDKKSIFTEGNYEMIKGEALGLRAFCHFDALRFYGPIPSIPGTSRILPYVKTVTKNVHESLDYQTFATTLLADLDEAENLLKDVDPIRKYSIAQLNPGANDAPVVNDNYLQYRQVRMNYYAILALKARVYMWLSASNPANRVNAAKYAQMVISGVDPTGKPTFRLSTSVDIGNLDYTMSSEHIMALSIYNLKQTAEDTFGEKGGLHRYDLSIQDGYYYLNNLFPVAERASDIRWQGMWAYKTTAGLTNYVLYKKYIQRPLAPVLQIPLLRLSEMYLILTECADNKAAAEIPYTTFCAAKGIPFTGFNNTDWTRDRQNKIIREYVREFYAEGQSFFTYKRFNLTTLPSSWTSNYYNATPATYNVPKPDREINYNNN